jgi:hypothetical protein
MAEGATTFAGMVGKEPAEAKDAILQINGALTVVVVEAGEPATLDHVADRVRIILGEDGKVAADPIVG